MPQRRKGGNKKKCGRRKPKQAEKEKNDVQDLAASAAQGRQEGEKKIIAGQCRQRTVPDPSRPANTATYFPWTNIGGTKDKTFVTAARKRNRKILKKNAGHLGDGGILTEYVTGFGTVKPGESLPLGVPSNFHLYQHATICKASTSIANSGKLGIFKHERTYQEYFQEIVKNEEEWMAFFKHTLNYRHVAQSIHLLAILVYIYRQRGDDVSNEKCEEVLGIYGKIICLFKTSCITMRRIINASDFQSLIGFYESSNFDYHFSCMHLYCNKNQLELAAQHLQHCLEFEVKKNLDSNHHMVLSSMIAIGLRPTAENVKNLTESQLIQLAGKLKESNRVYNKTEYAKAERNHVALVKCEACNKTESVIGDFKACGRCLSVHYCSRDCQIDHYKIHKKSCKEMAKTG